MGDKKSNTIKCMGKLFIVVMERLSIPTKQKRLCFNAKKKQKARFEH
ncbi:hypothetical protein HP10700_08696 [Helicobacter pylori 10700]|nr:hypothetical protein HP10700_08696 [Helicobacter pylori 10700]KAF0998263.1 hypothetical protein HPYSS1_06227 [Helicobacter pylori SS1]KAF1000620.1 hypothetical protein HPSS1190_01162 [Helicobacter pylori SS1_190]